jgi:hypothetical protein
MVPTVPAQYIGSWFAFACRPLLRIILRPAAGAELFRLGKEPDMARGCWAAVLVAWVVFAAGCGWARPRWLGGPGRIEQQQARAVVHDPFPDNQLGPEVVGGRPREYAQQVPQAVRSQPQGPLGNWSVP